MKRLTKKLVSLLFAVSTAVTSLSVSFAGVNAEDQTTSSVSSSDSDSGIQSRGLLPDLMPDQFNDLTNDNEEKANSDYAIYKIDGDDQTQKLIIDYSALTDSSVFIGFYNDEGTQLYTSVTVDAPKGSNTSIEVEKPEGLPKYYLIKAFMVGHYNAPLTQPFTYDKQTQAVQEIISKTANDFDKDKVVTFAENDINNFLVTKDEYTTIISDETKDTLKSHDDEFVYVFENIDKVKELKPGQTVLIRTPDTSMFFVVNSIKINGSEAVITKQIVNLEDIVSFIRYDSSILEDDPTISYVDNDCEYVDSYEIIDDSSDSGVSENGNTRSPAPDLSWLSTTFSKRIKFNLKGSPDEIVHGNDFGIESGISGGGYLELGFSFDIEVYYNSQTETNSVGGTFEVYAEFGIEGEASAVIRLGEIKIAAGFSIIPTLSLKASAAFTHRFSKSFDFGVRNHKEYSNTRKPPELNNSVSVTFEFSLGLDAGFNILDKSIFRISITPEIGMRFSLCSSSDQNNDYTIHECTDSCWSYTESLFLDFHWSVNILGHQIFGEQEKPKAESNHEADSGFEFATSSGHIKHGAKYDGPCPNLSHLVVLHVYELDPNVEYVEGSESYIPAANAKIYSMINNGNVTPLQDSQGKAIETDNDGYVSLWIHDSDLTNENFYLAAQSTSQKNAGVNVGKLWNPALCAANEFDIHIKNKTDFGIGESFPITGNCGSINLDTQTPYPVTFEYYSNGYCYISGSGEFDFYKLYKALEEYNITSIQRLIIGNGVDISSSHLYFLLDNKHNYEMFDHLVDELEIHGNRDKETTSIACNVEGLKKVDISDTNYTTITERYFAGSINIEEIHLPSTVTEIGIRAFGNDSSLKEFIAPKNLKTIGQSAFQKTDSLRNVYLNEKLDTIGEAAFMNSGLEKIKLPSSLTTIEDWAFLGSHLQSIEIPASVIKIGDAALVCPIKSITLNGNFNEDSRYANCKPFVEIQRGKAHMLESVILNDGVTKLNDSLFAGLETVSNVRFSKNLESIGNSAFYGCNIHFVNLPESLRSIGNYAFCDNLIDKVVIPKNVQSIGYNAFYKTSKKNSDGTLQTEPIEITILNPDCALGSNLVPDGSTIYGYSGSTAEKYATANKDKYKFVCLDPSTAATTSTSVTTSKTTTTTAQATTIVTNVIAPYNECVLIAVRNAVDAVTNAADLLKSDIAYADQQTADDAGIVSFSYIPDSTEKWALIFIPQAVGNISTQTIISDGEAKTTDHDITLSNVKGDANNDWSVDMSDVIIIMQALANPDKYGVNGSDKNHITQNGINCGDVNGGGLSGNDALYIQRYLLGLEKSL